MIGLVPNVGEARMIGLLVNASTVGSENLSLRLYKNDITPASTMTLADYTEASFTGYLAVTLTSSDWTITQDELAQATGPEVTFAASATTAETVYGYYISGVNSSTLYWSERFSAPFQLVNIGDAVVPTPVLRLQQRHFNGHPTLQNELAHYWRLDEASDESAPVTRMDAIGTNHLTDTNTVASISGKKQNAANFIAANLEKLSSTGQWDASATWTVSLWYYANGDQVSGAAIFGSAEFVSNSGASVLFSGITGSFVTARFRPAASPGNIAATKNAWHHVALYYDGSIGTLTLDNVTSISTAPVTYVPKAITGVGWTPDNIYFNGYVDEIGVWTRVLSSNERTALYNSGAGLFY